MREFTWDTDISIDETVSDNPKKSGDSICNRDLLEGTHKSSHYGNKKSMKIG